MNILRVRLPCMPRGTVTPARCDAFVLSGRYNLGPRPNGARRAEKFAAVWGRLHAGGDADGLYVASVYLLCNRTSPGAAQAYQDALDDLADDVAYCVAALGCVVLAGDFNARVGTQILP